MEGERPVILLARALEVGGAERQLVVLAQELHAVGVPVVVVVCYGLGPLGEELRQGGVPIVSIGKRHRWDLVGFLWRYVRTIRRLRPAVLYSYLVVPNLLALLGAPFIRGARIVLGLRAGTIGDGDDNWVTILAFRLVARFSFVADASISNSRAGAEFHVAQGFPASRMHVVPNGIDTGHFRPDAEGARRFRQELGVADDIPLIGMVKRMVPLKDHSTFIAACALLASRLPTARFLAIGGGEPALAARLRAEAEALGLAERLQWLGPRQDMPAIFSALTVHVSTSQSEGFPNVLGEAMACGCPCVATRAGDSTMIVGALGILVEDRAPAEVAEGVLELMRRDKPEAREACRRSIVERFSRTRLRDRTREVLGV